jgi:hypothetical protein
MIRTRLRRHYQVPEIPAVGVLNPDRGFFSVIIPIARTNLVTNPSVEKATTGYTASGGSIAQSSAEQYHGVYSLAVTPTAALTDGAYYTISLTSGQIYAVSCKFLGVAGRKYLIGVYTTGAVELVSYHFTATGRWQWVWVYYTETSSTSRRVYVRKDSHASAAVFYVDGLQVEAINAGETVSTYIDGDQQPLLTSQFPAPYYWNGTPHASTSSRLKTTRAGGYVMNLDHFRFKVLAYAGLGLATIANISTQPATTDGAAFQSTIVRPRQFVVNGLFEAPSLGTLQRAQADLYSAIGPESASPRQPLVLSYQAHDSSRALGQEGRIVASYSGGLEGLTNNPYRDTVPISFTQYLPSILAGEAGVPLNVQISVSNANDILQRSPAGIWSALGTGGNGAVQVLAIGLDGKIYAGGAFTLMGGVANTSRIAYWDGSAWNAMGTGANATVRGIAVGPDGSVYASGDFTLMGGVANTARIAKWNGSAWSALGTGITTAASIAYAVAVAPNGDVYVTGDFTAPATRIAFWNGSVWAGLSTGLNDLGDVLLFDYAGNLYVGGDFTTAGGVSASHIAKWSGAAWTALSGGLNSSVIGLAFGLDGTLYAAGAFTNAGYPYIAQWNGSGWRGLGAGIDNLGTGLLASSDGLLYVGGTFTASGNYVFPDSFAIWNRSAFVGTGVDLPAASNVRTIVQATDGTITIGYNQTGTATATANTTATNDGTARAYPTITITGPSSGTSKLYELINRTNGKSLYLSYTINSGETLTIRTSPNGTTISSSFRGDVTSAIQSGSSPDFALEKGDNTISFFAASSTVTAVMYWSLAFQSVADLSD